ncbi:hypothetical protein ABT117_16985 [Streptomyces sp. NPDC002262]|uniref:hypothetical protein n=1 Tax=Streptomyces sp. NPDC002262 TaxID=3154414 RepID=UPI00332A38CC
MTTTTAPPYSHLQESLFAWLTPVPAASKTTTARPAPAKKAPAPTAPPAPPAKKKAKKSDVAHVWVVAAEIVVTPRIASIADYRGSFKTEAAQRVEALEVYCKGCRRPYDEAKGEPCAAKIDNTHLIGGDQTTRAKRKTPAAPPQARLIPGQKIERRGLDAYITGVSRTRS